MVNNNEIRSLLLSVSKRDAAAFISLYEQTAPILVRVARRIVWRRELAEEVVQDAYLKLWRSNDSFDAGAANPLGWLCTIVRNGAIDAVTSPHAHKSQSSEPDLESLALSEVFLDASVDRLAQQRLARAVNHWLGELRAPERQAIALAYFHEMTHAEIATHMRLPLGTVKSFIKRGLGNMRQSADEQETLRDNTPYWQAARDGRAVRAAYGGPEKESTRTTPSEMGIIRDRSWR